MNKNRFTFIVTTGILSSLLVISWVVMGILWYNMNQKDYLNTNLIDPGVTLNENQSTHEGIESSILVSEESADQTTFTLRLHNGKLSVFRGTDKEPFEVFDVAVETFSEYDRYLLEQGIKADDEESLQKLLEDYTS